MTSDTRPETLTEAAPRGDGRAELTAVAALAWLTFRQHIHSRRLVVLAVLFALPGVFAVVVQYFMPVPARLMEFGLVYTLFPHALVPLAALWAGSGMIQDEVEDQTLTYLLARPLPRWAVYIVKLLVTVAVMGALTAAFTVVVYAALSVREPALGGSDMAVRAGKASVLMAFGMLAYCSVFGALSLFARRSLVVGVAYILILEGLVANIDFVARRLTVMYYFRVLVERWEGLLYAPWSIDLGRAPGAIQAVGVLLGVSAAATALAAGWFTMREFRVKTPEGN